MARQQHKDFEDFMNAYRPSAESCRKALEAKQRLDEPAAVNANSAHVRKSPSSIFRRAAGQEAPEKKQRPASVVMREPRPEGKKERPASVVGKSERNSSVNAKSQSRKEKSGKEGGSGKKEKPPPLGEEVPIVVPPPEVPEKRMENHVAPPSPAPALVAAPPLLRRESHYPVDLPQDWIVLPTQNATRFLPYHYNLGIVEKLKVVEMPEPTFYVVIDFKQNPTKNQNFLEPIGAFGLTVGDDTLMQLYQERAVFKWAKDNFFEPEGMVLMNVERLGQFPCLTYVVLKPKAKQGLWGLASQLKSTLTSLVAQSPRQIGAYEEIATIGRPPLDPVPKPANNKTGYIISAFRVLPGDDRLKFERNWLTWTGAAYLYTRLPEQMGLRRISIHKTMFSERVITYVLMCECANIMDHVTEACVALDQLRARCCGYTGLYRVVDRL